MSFIRTSLMTTAVLYLLYVLKWSLGINLFSDFHAPKIVKLPAEIAVSSIQKLGLAVALPGPSRLEQTDRNMAAFRQPPVL